MLIIVGIALSYYLSRILVEEESFPDEDTTQNITDDGDNKIIYTKKVSKVGEAGLMVYPCGFPIGVYLETDGVMVIGTGTVKSVDGLTYEPSLSKIYPGDYILAINDIDINSKSQLLFLINKYGNNDVILTIKRNNNTIDIKISPVQVSETEYKLGIWVRDDSQGIGTMTFITNSGLFGALGHGISDVDTGELLNAAGGTLYGADIWGIKKGESGNPGGLYGVINYEDKNILGEINSNTNIGIYGSIDPSELVNRFDLDPIKIATKDEIKTGKAYIRSCVSGEIKDYEIEIEKVNPDCKTNKGIVIHVTDEELLMLTGGIVQGMSGSPIIQDGKLIGAVTHVFVKDSTKGYGIFIETMLEKCR